MHRMPLMQLRNACGIEKEENLPNGPKCSTHSRPVAQQRSRHFVVVDDQYIHDFSIQKFTSRHILAVSDRHLKLGSVSGYDMTSCAAATVFLPSIA